MRSRSTSIRCRPWSTAPPPRRAMRLLFEAARSNPRSRSPACVATRRRAFKDAPIRGASVFRSSATPRCPWSRAACLRNGMPQRPPHGVRCRQSGLPQSAHPGEADGLPETAIRMVENDVGGGFGARGEFYPEDFLIPFAARFTGRPVKWIEDRREHLLATNHAREAECELEIACDERRHHPRATRPRVDRSGRLHPHQWADRRAQYRAGSQRAVSHSPRPHRCLP